MRELRKVEGLWSQRIHDESSCEGRGSPQFGARQLVFLRDAPHAHTLSRHRGRSLSARLLE